MVKRGILLLLALECRCHRSLSTPAKGVASRNQPVFWTVVELARQTIDQATSPLEAKNRTA